jgi:uncharacterized protein (TIGR04255 family)
MAQARFLAHAPATEAIIDLRTQAAEHFSIEDYAQPPVELAADYPEPKPISLQEFGVTAHADGRIGESKVVNHGCVGRRFTSSDGKHIVQLRKDGFTFSRLAPYTSWEDVWSVADGWLAYYLKERGPVEVKRLAVRYINRLPLPAPDGGVDLKKYLTAPPNVPDGLNVFVDGFLTQVQVADPDGRIRATLTQALRPVLPTERDVVPVVLDIDAFEIGPFMADVDYLRIRFTALRNYKNRLFFASITEDAADLFT